MHNFLRYPLCSIPSGAIDPSSAHHASVPLPSSQTTDAKFATRQAEVMPDVSSKVSYPEVTNYDQARTAIDGKALCDREIQPATGESLPSIKGGQLDKADQKELKKTQNQLLKQADELLKKSNEKKAVTASLSGLKQSLVELKKAQNNSPEEALKALKNTQFPPALKVKITLKSREEFSLIPPGDKLKDQPNLGKLMEKAVAILEKHHNEHFASFDQATTDREITDLKQHVSDIDQQIGEEATGLNDFARLENRHCLLTINVRRSSVNATHIDRGPIAQRPTTGSPMAGPGHTGTTGQPPQAGPRVEQDNDRPAIPEVTRQDLTDSNPADQDMSINSTNNGDNTDSLYEPGVDATFDNPAMRGDASLIPGIVQNPSEQTDSTTTTSSQPDDPRHTGNTGDDYSELDGVADLFAEPELSGDSAGLSVGDDYSELDGVAKLFAEPGLSGDSAGLSVGDDYSKLDGVAKLFTEPELSGDSAELDDNQSTNISVRERSGDKVPIDSVNTTEGTGQSDVGAALTQTEEELARSGDEISIHSTIPNGETDQSETGSLREAVKSTGETPLEEDFSELDGVADLFAEPELTGDSADLEDNQGIDVSVRGRSGDNASINSVTSTDDADQSDVGTESVQTETALEISGDKASIDRTIPNGETDQSETGSLREAVKSTGETPLEEDFSELDGVADLFAEPELTGDSADLDDNQEIDVSVRGRSRDNASIDSVTSTDDADQSDVGTESVQTETALEISGDKASIDRTIPNGETDQSETGSLREAVKSTGETPLEEDFSELDGVADLFAEPELTGDSAALDDNQEIDVSVRGRSGDNASIDSVTSTDDADQSDVDTESVQTETALELSGDKASIDRTIPNGETDQSETGSLREAVKSTGETPLEENFSELDGVADLFAEPELTGDSAALDDNQGIDVSVSGRSGDNSSIDSVTSTDDADQSDVGTESFVELKTQENPELISALATGEDKPSLVNVAGIDDAEPSEMALQQSDNSGGDQDSIPEGTVFHADNPGHLEGSVSNDPDNFSEGEEGRVTTQTLRPEPDVPVDVTEESVPMDRAEEVRQAMANTSERAELRMKKELQPGSTSESTTPSPATPTNRSPAINKNKDHSGSSELNQSQVAQATAGTTHSSFASKSTSEIINKPIDVSGVTSIVAAQINATRKAKSIDSIPKEERAIDQKKLGVSSVYNEANVIKNAFDKLQKNASNLKVSKDIARIGRKYISNEAQDSKPFLSGPDRGQSEALRFLGLTSNASERDIRLALFDKASESAESGNRKHDSTMKTLSKHHKALFNK
ncbi:hypothetical protein [Endozoicomonas sp. SCSIO W0465]|uniref:hypothetical protein n=1 Tax=Endozoicomonas sp. SCSIO W0465 TaxID=2918516 RepID=UPI002075A0AB|nr:hypothetical protein [Endozoicomonas sp. SCSIO W0465]USE37102.1 hypothetical protein MJO57_02405 [Endozoicomonas sp. SCSIO W0465]